MAIATLLALAPGAAYAQSPAAAGYDETDVIGSLPGGGGDTTPPAKNGEVLGDAVSGGGAVDADDADSAPVTRSEAGASPPTTATGSLPFTGFDAGLLALMGLALLGTGLALRRGSLNRG